ncbi:hypothetical protein Tco_1006868 [Tanacetum coccineum]|uniref:Uncharacterized protein n=1 Tax=Tanacetum coccineum TaxID=301880 RepID=A0ABQ5FIZ5_9ASTR
MEITAVTLVEEQMSLWKVYEQPKTVAKLIGRVEKSYNLKWVEMKVFDSCSLETSSMVSFLESLVSKHTLVGLLTSASASLEQSFKLVIALAVEEMGEVRVMTKGFGDLVAKLGDKVVMEVLVRCWSDGDVVVRSW